MHLDIRTIVFITAVIQALYSIGLFFISRSWIKSPVLNMVALAFACGSIGAFLMSFRDIINPFLSVVVANVFVLSNPVFILEGVLRFRAVRSRVRFVGPVFLCLLVPIFLYATFLKPDLNVRIVTISLFFCIQSLICAYMLVNKIDKKYIVPAYATAGFFVFAAVVMSVRIVLSLFQVDVIEFMASSDSQSFVQLSHIIYITGVTFGFIWLNTRKLGLNLATALHNVDDGIHSQFTFIDVISHELKTPLATIQNSTESLFMRLEKEMSPAQEKAFGRINRSLERLDNIIEVGMKQKRLTFDQIHKNIAPVSIVELLQTSAEVCKGAFPKHKVVIKHHRSFSGRIDIPADHNSLLTALNNILTNSMKYSSSDETIIVEIGQSEKMLALSVKDRGCGIEPENKEKVFEKDFRDKNTGTVPGDGLGLFIVRHIIKAHNGMVTIQNRTYGGCRVDICLPVDQGNKNLNQESLHKS